MTKRTRRWKRVKRRLPARARQEGEEEVISGVTRDFSPDGLFIETQYPFSPGSKVMIELAFSGDTIQFDGVVAQASKAEAHLRAMQVSGMAVNVAFSPEQEKDLVTDPVPKRRINIDSAVVVYFGSDNRELQLSNLSASGAALIGDSELPDISFVRMIFRLTDSSQPIEVTGIPVRSEETEDGTLIGMRFMDPPDSVVAQIEEFILDKIGNSTDGIDHERRSRKSRRGGMDQRIEKLGIKNVFPFSLFLEKRKSTDRRSGTDRRKG